MTTAKTPAPPDEEPPPAALDDPPPAEDAPAADEPDRAGALEALPDVSDDEAVAPLAADWAETPTSELPGAADDADEPPTSDDEVLPAEDGLLDAEPDWNNDVAAPLPDPEDAAAQDWHAPNRAPSSAHT